jgi:hypothetical protein
MLPEHPKPAVLAANSEADDVIDVTAGAALRCAKLLACTSRLVCLYYYAFVFYCDSTIIASKVLDELVQ